ncbi:MAG TPA: hypothetical protein PLF40_20515 [Kofleriaceae bacterium]|nr:hypothetical protein [Kofleriaceae bacterium]
MTSLTTRRDYLARHRKTIIARSLAGTLVAAVPLPFLDDWTLAAVLGGGYKRIAADYQIDLDETAIKNLVHGRAQPLAWGEVALSSIGARIAGRTARRMMVALATARGASAAQRTFVTMTLFDHYCAKLHTGLGLDGNRALALRDEIGRAIDATPGALAFHPFRRGALAAVRAVARAPFELADMASAGAIRRLLSRGESVAEPEALTEIDAAVEAQLAESKSFLARTVTAVEAQLSAEANPFLDAVIDNFERRWRARMAAKVD